MAAEYLSAILQEEELITTHHEQVAHSVGGLEDEFLRYAVLKLLEKSWLQTSRFHESMNQQPECGSGDRTWAQYPCCADTSGRPSG